MLNEKNFKIAIGLLSTSIGFVPISKYYLAK